MFTQVKLFVDYSYRNDLNNFVEIKADLFSCYLIKDNIGIYFNEDTIFMSTVKYNEELDLYYPSDSLFINLGKVPNKGSIKNEKEYLFNMYEKLNSTSLLAYFLSPVFNRMLDEDFDITELLKQ